MIVTLSGRTPTLETATVLVMVVGSIMLSWRWLRALGDEYDWVRIHDESSLSRSVFEQLVAFVGKGFQF